MSETEYQKLKHDLETLIELNRGNSEARERYKSQLEELKKRRPR